LEFGDKNLDFRGLVAFASSAFSGYDGGLNLKDSAEQGSLAGCEFSARTTTAFMPPD
jgi:hypothetical protein